MSAAQWDSDFQAHRGLFELAHKQLNLDGKIYMVKANYPDLLEMIELASSFGFQTAVIGESKATEDDQRVYYALSLSLKTGNNA